MKTLLNNLFKTILADFSIFVWKHCFSMGMCSLKINLNLKSKTKLKKAIAKILLNVIFYKINPTDFCVDTLFLNEHGQFKNETKLRN